MSRMQRDKGARNERDLVNKLKAAGLDAKRVPLSGACEGFKGDVVVIGYTELRYSGRRDEDGRPTPGFIEGELTIECKVRARGFKFIYDNIDGNDILAIRSDHNEWLVVERLSDWMKRL